MGVALLLPWAKFAGGAEIFRLTAAGLHRPDGSLAVATLYLPVVLLVTLHVPVVALFAFKRRRAQMRMCYVSLVMLSASQVAICLSIRHAAHVVSGFGPGRCASSLSPTAVLPVVAFVLVWMALMAIRKDERLVRSLDRIR